MGSILQSLLELFKVCRLPWNRFLLSVSFRPVPDCHKETDHIFVKWIKRPRSSRVSSAEINILFSTQNKVFYKDKTYHAPTPRVCTNTRCEPRVPGVGQYNNYWPALVTGRSNQPNNQRANSGRRRPPVCLAIPALTASLGSIRPLKP